MIDIAQRPADTLVFNSESAQLFVCLPVHRDHPGEALVCLPKVSPRNVQFGLE